MTLEGVSLLREGQPILRDVDWSVREGQRWIVLGPNGAGKTTLLELASLYLFPSTGLVTVLGAVHGRTDVRPMRRRIGYASAALARLLHPDLTVLDAVATGRSGVLDPYWSEPDDDDRALALALLRRLGCAALAGHRFGALSEGERQRVQVARALMASPDLLLLDEPSAGLDLGARELLVRSLAGLAADPRMRAIVFVTQHVEEIPAGFTHVLLLRSGRVLAAGPVQETLTPKLLSACFGIPLAVEERNGRWTAWAVEEAAVHDGRRAGTRAGSGGTAGDGPAAPRSGPTGGTTSGGSSRRRRRGATGGEADDARGSGARRAADQVRPEGDLRLGASSIAREGRHGAAASGAGMGGAGAAGREPAGAGPAGPAAASGTGDAASGSGQTGGDACGAASTGSADGAATDEQPPPPGGAARGQFVRDPDGRYKVFRPLAPAARLAALDRFLDAYTAGEYFAAHEVLEPGWMGTDDPAERALHQGLIKLAAGGVHAARGNPEGVRRNFAGAARRLAMVPPVADGVLGAALDRVDLPVIQAWLQEMLEALEAAPDGNARGAVADGIAATPAPVRRSGAGA